MSPALLTLDRAAAQLLVVDMQQRLMPHIDRYADVCGAAERMLQAATLLEIPITVTEQYVRGLGATLTSISAAAVDAARLEKMTFSVFADRACRRHLEELGRPQILLLGIETHVCVQQTALDLVRSGFSPVLLADAAGSRRALDRDVAIERMRSAGVVITTTESAIFEMLHEAGTELFRRVLPIVK